MIEEGPYTYTFSEAELRDLALLLRRMGRTLPRNLEDLSGFLESALYGIMTIEEAELFFNET